MMSDTRPNDSDGRRAQVPSMAGPVLDFDLTKELAQLRQAPEWGSGQSARTLVKYDDLRVVLTALAAGARLPGHRTRGRISIQALTGHIQVRTNKQTFDLPAGRLLALDRDVEHDVEALEESAFLLTIAWPGAPQAA